MADRIDGAFQACFERESNPFNGFVGLAFRAGAEWMRAEAVTLARAEAVEWRRVGTDKRAGACEDLATAIESLGSAPESPR